MRILALAAALLLGSVTAAAAVGGLVELPAPGAGPNLVVNGDFQAPAAAGPAGWRLGPDPDLWALDGGPGEAAWSLRLAGADRAGQVAAAEQTLTLEPGLYTIAARVRAEALGEGTPRTGARLCLDGRPRVNWWRCTDIVRGTRNWESLRREAIVVRQPGAYRLTVGGFGRPAGTAWFADVSVTRVLEPALDVYLLYPNFKGMLFDDQPQRIRLAMRVRDATSASGARVRLRLVEEAGGTVRGTWEHAAGTDRVTVDLDAGSLPLGAYRIRAELLDRSGEVVDRYPDYRIVKVAAAERRRLALWYDEDNVVHLHGVPRFVLGLYTTSGYSLRRESYVHGRDGWGTLRMAEAPIDLVVNYWLHAAPVPALEAYMDELQARGMSLLHTVNTHHPDDPEFHRIPHRAAAEGADALNRWVARALRPHRGLAGFYTADEQPADVVPRVFQQYGVLREAAPGAVTYAVLGNGWQDQAPLWRDAVDVLGLDPYPLSRKPADNHLAMVGEWTRLGQDAVMGSRPLWMVIQFFEQTRVAGWPTYDDLRTMSWMAIIEGARGLFYWSFGARGLAWVKDPELREQRWQDLVRVTREIRALEPVLLAPDARVVDAGQGGAIRTLGKRLPDGTRYLFAYNPANTTSRVTWMLAGPAHEIVDLDTGQPIAAADRRLSASFAPYEVKRYRLR
jgi:hypothetical protein